MKVITSNLNIIRLIRRLDKTRNLFTAIYYISDTADIICYNVLFLPFIYYAVEKKMAAENYLVVAAGLLIVILFNTVYNKVYRGYICQLSDQKLNYNYNCLIMKKAKEFDLIDTETREYNEYYSMLINEGAARLTEGLDMIWWAISAVLLFFVYVSVIGSIDILLIGLCAVCSLAVFFMNLRYAEWEYNYNVNMTKTSRKIDYFYRIFSLGQYASDLRTSNLSRAMIKDYDTVAGRKFDIIDKTGSKLRNIDIMKTVLLFITTSVITTLYLSFLFLVQKKISLSTSEIIVAQTLMLQMSTILSDIANIYPKLKKNKMYLEDYDKFMNYQPQIRNNETGKLPRTSAHSIILQGVSFSYDKDKFVLNNINMHINAGEKVAIVGPNGSGKTTLIKLIMRLYLPDQGMVLFDNVPADNYNLEAYRERFSTAFQECNIYSLSLAENVLMDIFKTDKEELVMEALEKVGMKKTVLEYPEGMSSTMTREFNKDGVTLSGGQNQKIAISRIYAKESGVIILDEPSSALDPISENKMYRAMLDGAQGKTLILISHRLSSAKDVDKIYYMENGFILETGSHKELLNLNGRYAEMWHEQADKYAENSL